MVLNRDVDKMAKLTVVSTIEVDVATGGTTDCVVATTVMQAQTEE